MEKLLAPQFKIIEIAIKIVMQLKYHYLYDISGFQYPAILYCSRLNVVYHGNSSGVPNLNHHLDNISGKKTNYVLDSYV